MGDEILPIPVIPDGLREVARRGVVIPFIGAGVSRLAGCPSWAEFADLALMWFVNQGAMDHETFAQMRHLPPRVKLSMALEREKLRSEAGKLPEPIKFEKLLHPSGDCSHPKGRHLYGSLSAFSKKFITTNYDWWLDKPISLSPAPQKAGSNQPLALQSPDRKRIIQMPEFKISAFAQPDVVLHLHGSVDDRSSMILTTADYARHYANDKRNGKEENRVLTLIDELFDQYTMLFIGYGMDELEILEYVISNKRKPVGEDAEAKHYLLQGFFSHEHALMKELRSYYSSQCRVTLIPYLRDELDWDQLLEVVANFADKMPIGEPPVSEKLTHMAKLLHD